MANSILAKMAVQISANTAEFNKALSKTNKEISSFTGGIKNIAGTLGVAFGVHQIASFTLEISKLAGEAVGVENAFKRLKNSTALMVELKEATGGTVSELELMKRAVQAGNFDISLKALPKLLEFATLRAQQTGQSVDYLVDSIVTGIGRKSKLILDNLGISASQLSAEFKGASLEAQSVGDVTEAVGRIAERNLKDMATFSQNASTSVQQLSASWEDLKVSLGKLVNQSGIPKFVAELASIAKFFAGDFTLTKVQVEKLIIGLNKLRDAAKLEGNQEDVRKYTLEIAKLASQYNLLKDKEIDPTTKKIDEQTVAVKKLVKAKDDLKLQFSFDPEVEGSTNLDLVNEREANATKQFAIDIAAIGTSAEFTGGALIQLGESISENVVKPIQEASIEIGGLVAGGLTDLISGLADASVSGGNFGQAILRSLGAFAQQFGAILIAAGIGKKSFDTFSGPQMIAAGAALVALGGVVRATIANRPNLGSASGGGRSSFSGGSYGTTGLGTGITLSGDFELQGYSLQLLLDKQTYKNGRVGG